MTPKKQRPDRRQSPLFLVLGAFACALVTGGFVHLPTPVNGQSPAPPSEAFDACVGREENDRCTVRLRHGDIDGRCQMMSGQPQVFCVPANGRGQGERPDRFQRGGRQHTTIQSIGNLDLLPATQLPITQSRVEMVIKGRDRVLRMNGISEHLTGPFPNRGNPNPIREQAYEWRVPAEPVLADDLTPLGLDKFGVALNGVPFDPGAAEFYLGDRRRGWRYEALSGAIQLGLDENYAHVQPSGAYHYHGLPSLHLDGIAYSDAQHSPQIGWAADGFPIYAVYGYISVDDPTSGVKLLSSSYRLRDGNRPGAEGEPGGIYDGTFVRDYEYVSGAGDLDECNGRYAVTPEFPDGTYAYFLTPDWPVIPRCFRGTPSTDFENAPPGSRRRPR